MLIFKLVYFIIFIEAIIIDTHKISLMIQFLSEKQYARATPTPIKRLIMSRTLIFMISLICSPFYRMLNLSRNIISFEHTHMPATPIINMRTYMMGLITLVVVSARMPPVNMIAQNTKISEYVILIPPPPIDQALE